MAAAWGSMRAAGRSHCAWAQAACAGWQLLPDALLAPVRPTHARVQVAPGARLAVGAPDTALAFAFAEGGSSAMAEMLMQGLAATASQEVREQLKEEL